MNNEAQSIDHTKVQTQDADFWTKAVALNVTIGRIGTHRKSNVAVNTDADQAMFSVHKNLLDCDELKEIVKLDNQIRNELRKWILPNLFKDGVYLVPNVLVIQAYDFLTAKKAERDELVRKFKEAYEVIKASAKARLKDEFRASDYPATETLDALFKFDFKVISFGVPDTLKEIQASIWEKEKEKAVQSWQETGDVIREALRNSFKALLDHMVEKLTPDEDGNPKTFKRSTVENVSGFFEEFQAKNICDDNELADLVAKAKDVLHGVTPDALRTNDSLRKTVLEKIGAIKETLDANLITQTGRRYLDDSE
jgi:hypothetical protein